MLTNDVIDINIYAIYAIYDYTWYIACVHASYADIWMITTGQRINAHEYPTVYSHDCVSHIGSSWHHLSLAQQ